MWRREILSMLGLFAAGCGRPSAPGGPMEVTVSMSEHLTVSSMRLAEELGYLREAGFELKKVSLSTLQAVPLLAGGKLDIALGGISSPVLNAVGRGMRLRVVAGREHVSPNCGDGYTLYANRNAFAGGAVEPRRLKGKRFSVRSRGITEFILDAFLKEHGMTADDVQCVDLPLREAIVALAGNKIDATFDTELSRSPLATSPDIVKVWRYADAYPFHQYSFILFGERMLDAGLETGGRFLAAYLQGAGEFLDGSTPAFMREFAAKHGLDGEKTIAECRDTFPRDGAIDTQSVQRIIDWNAGKGYAVAKPTIAQLVDDRFLKMAQQLQRDGTWRLSKQPGKR